MLRKKQNKAHNPHLVPITTSTGNRLPLCTYISELEMFTEESCQNIDFWGNKSELLNLKWIITKKREIILQIISIYYLIKSSDEY